MFTLILIIGAFVVAVAIAVVVVLNSGQQQEQESHTAASMYQRLIEELEREREEIRARLGEQIGYAKKLKRQREALLANIVEWELNATEAKSTGRSADAAEAEAHIDEALEKVASIDATLKEVAPVVRRLKKRVSDLDERIRAARVRKARGENAGFDAAASKVDDLFERIDEFS